MIFFFFYNIKSQSTYQYLKINFWSDKEQLASQSKVLRGFIYIEILLVSAVLEIVGIFREFHGDGNLKCYFVTNCFNSWVVS